MSQAIADLSGPEFEAKWDRWVEHMKNEPLRPFRIHVPADCVLDFSPQGILDDDDDDDEEEEEDEDDEDDDVGEEEDEFDDDDDEDF